MAAQTIILNGFTMNAVSQGNCGLWLHPESRNQLCNRTVSRDLARPMAEEPAGMAAE